MRPNSITQSRLRDGGTVILEFLSGLVVIGSAVPLSAPLGGASIVVMGAGAALLAHAFSHVMHFVLAVPVGLALAVAIYFPLVALISD